MPTEVCMDSTKKWSPSGFFHTALRILDSALAWKCESFTHACFVKLFPVQAARLHSKEAKDNTNPEEKSCSHLGDQTKAGGFSLSQGCRYYIKWMFQVCSAQIAFRANYSKMRKLTLWEDAWLYLYRHTQRCTRTPTYFCDFSYFFSLCYAIMSSKFVMLRFKALPVIQVSASLKSEQKDPKFAFIVVFPVKTIV